MAKKNKQEEIMTPSGHQADRELAKVPIKVSPSLQALIANQIELIDMVKGKKPLDRIFLEQHSQEMLQVEGEIESSFVKHARKKEIAREQRQAKKEAVKEKQIAAELRDVNNNHDTAELEFSPPLRPVEEILMQNNDDHTEPLKDKFNVDIYDGEVSSGLPSAKYESPRKPAEIKKEEPDVRRVALGASIKALQEFLGRELTEEEIQALEAQVDSYLVN